MNNATLQIAPAAALEDPRQNHLLAALPQAEWARWADHLEPLDMPLGLVLCEAGSTPAYVYFPTTAIVSLLYVTRDGDSTEFAVVGNDGAVGITLFLGGQATPSQAVVQSAGRGYRLPAQVAQASVERSGPLLSVLLRYAQAVMVQMAQTVVCNRFHSIDRRLSRRLLLSLDRSPHDALSMTHEAAALLLGVRREGVTAAALKLQKAGVIRYHRGCIEVIDRPRLEQCACECYAVARNEHERLLPIPRGTSNGAFRPHGAARRSGAGATASAR